MRITEVTSIEPPKKSFSLSDSLPKPERNSNIAFSPKPSKGVPITLQMLKDFIESSK